jgi:hypothetical protein
MHTTTEYTAVKTPAQAVGMSRRVFLGALAAIPIALTAKPASQQTGISLRVSRHFNPQLDPTRFDMWGSVLRPEYVMTVRG